MGTPNGAATAESKGFLPYADAFGKVVLVFAAGSYVVGFFIVNLSLANHGVFVPDLLRVEHVAAGALWIVLSGFTFACCWALYRVGVYFSAHRAKAGCVALGICAIVVYQALAASISLLTGWERLSHRRFYAILVLLIAHAALIGFSLLHLHPSAEKHWTRLANRDVEGTVMAPWIVKSFRPISLSYSVVAYGFLLVWAYATFAYPSFLRVYGGGKHELATLKLKPEVAALAARIGVTLDENNITPPVLILAETSDRVVFTSARNEMTALSVPAGAIEGIIYRGPAGLERQRRTIRQPWTPFVEIMQRRFRRNSTPGTSP